MFSAVYFRIACLAIQLWLSVVVLFSPAVAQTTADWKEKLRTTFAAWQTELSEVSVVFEYTLNSIHGGDKPQKKTYLEELRRMPNAFSGVLYQIEDENGIHTGQVWGRNRDYLFEINRTDPHSPWRESRLYQLRPKPVPPEAPLVGYLTQIEAGQAWFPFAAHGVLPLFSLIGRSRFDVVSVEESETLLKVEVVTIPEEPKPGEPRKKPLHYRLELDPGNGLVPIRVHNTQDGGFSIEYSDYREVEGLSVKVPFHVAWESPKAEQQGGWQIKRAAVGTVKEADCRFPAFGLKEPDFVLRRRLWP